MKRLEVSHMKHKSDVLKEIDAAIDDMDMVRIEAGLNELPAPEPDGIENPKAFAARIQKINKERTEMKKPFRFITIAGVAVVLMAGAAFAAGGFNGIIFPDGDKIVTARSTDAITEDETRGMLSEPESNTSAQPTESQDVNTQEFTFDTKEQAAEQLDIVIPFPSALPEMVLDSATGSIRTHGEDYRESSLWLTYKDDAGRMFGITESRHILKPGSTFSSTTTSDMDEGSFGKYVSKSGVEYSTFTESNDEGTMTAHIALASIGEYDYAILFVEFDEAERNAIIDSTDLSALK